MPQIRIQAGQPLGKTVEVEGEKRVLIGRDRQATLRLSDKGVSREHAEIYRVGEMVFIRDLGSRNGTCVNGERVPEELLREGDVIRVGNTQLVFESTRAARARGPGVAFQEGADFQTSIELRMEDLLADSRSAWSGRAGELFHALCLATSLVHTEPDEQKLFEALLELIQEHVQADHLHLFLRDEGGTIVPRAMRQAAEAGSGVPVSRTILKRVIGESRAVLTADASRDDRFKAGDSILLHAIRAVLCAPVHAPAGALGALYVVNSKEPESFDQADLELLAAIGTQLGRRLSEAAWWRRRQTEFLALVKRLVGMLPQASAGALEHAERVAACAAAVARELGLPEPAAFQVRLAGLLHDCVPGGGGASGAPEAPVPGAEELLQGLPGMEDARQALRARGERFDGRGTPGQLKGEAIPLGARILAVAEAFDELLYAARPDAPQAAAGARLRQAFTALEAEAGKACDPAVVKALVVAHRHGMLQLGNGGGTVSSGDRDGTRPAAEADATPEAEAGPAEATWGEMPAQP